MMPKRGVVKLEALGEDFAIVLPPETLDAVGLTEGSVVTFTVENGTVYIRLAHGGDSSQD